MEITKNNKMKHTSFNTLCRLCFSKTDVMNLLESAGFSRSNPYYIVKQGKVVLAVVVSPTISNSSSSSSGVNTIYAILLFVMPYLLDVSIRLFFE